MTDPVQQPSASRVLAFIDASEDGLEVVRQAGRLARQLGAPWSAVHVAAPSPAVARHRETLLQALRLAEELGADTQTLNGEDSAAEIIAFARRENITHVVAAGPRGPAWLEFVTGRFLQRLQRDAHFITVVVARKDESGSAALAEIVQPPPLGEPAGYLVATALVGLATLFAVAAYGATGLPNISLIYVLAVIATAVRYGAAVAIFTAMGSALAYNFFLTDPLYTFSISDPANVWAVFFFLTVAVIVSAVAAHTRAQTRIARRQAEQAAELQGFAQQLVGAGDELSIANAAANAAAKLLVVRATILVPRHGALEAIAESHGPETLMNDDLAAAQWAFEHGREAGRGADTLENAQWLFVAALGEGGPVAVLGVRPIDAASRLDPEQRRLLDLVANQAGVALDRLRFAHAAADQRVATEGERLKSVLLSGVSHDLRTPLTAIRGALEAVLRLKDRHDDATRDELLRSAAGETQKLAGFIDNLLDAARLDRGVRAQPRPSDVVDIIDAAIERAHAHLEGRRLSRDVHSDLPSIVVDPALTETAIANVLENAGEHAPQHSTILVRAYRQNGKVAIEVLDEGPGFPERALAHPFAMFERGVEGDGRPPGTGLGLAIAKGFLEAEGAAIEATNRGDRSGARVTMVFPTDAAV